MSSALSATAGASEASSCATRVTLQVMSAGELMLTTMRRIGTRVMIRQRWDNFVPGRGIML